ncbi:MAG: hypothetical protein COA79_11910 [Planctomycetota bacterium]|nr:MAG: hypothetical protein COA79_11910 [Planctomycetota bacterium]
MIKKDLAELILKTLAVVFFVFALKSLPNFLYLLRSDTPSSQMIMAPNSWIIFNIFRLTLTPLIISIILWLTSGYFSEKYFSTSTAPMKLNDLSKNDIRQLIFSGIGLYLCVTSLSDLSTLLYNYMHNKEIFDQYNTLIMSNKMFGEIIGQFIQLILSLILIFGSNGLNGLLTKIETAGNKSKDL